MRSDDYQDLLLHYQGELTYLHNMGAEFARRYPKIASRLALDGNGSTDPHVERLIEAFAFLTGRIQYNITRDFPQISTALLGILYPQYLNPVPPITIARFEADPKQGKFTTGYLVPRHTPLYASTPEGLICRMRTCYPVTLWPLDVTEVAFDAPAKYRFLEERADIATVLRLRIQSLQGPLPELELQNLRFFIHGERFLTSTLYETLTCRVQQIALWPDTAGNPTTSAARPVYLPPDSLEPAGFGLEEEVLPYPAQAHPGYRLLQEFFTFPDKYMFVDLCRLDHHGAQNHFDILFLIDRAPHGRPVVNPQTFQLGCTPVINLFRKTTEPIRLDQRQPEYRLVADMRRQRTTEIHSIQRVSSTPNAQDETTAFEPFYSYTHHLQRNDHKTYWYARRQPTNRRDLPGTDVYLTFLDLDYNPSQPPEQAVYAHTLCTNRDLAEHLTAGDPFYIEDVAPLARITCLRTPTWHIDPPLGGSTVWRLISHLSLNYLSLTGDASLPALQEILKLYNVADSPIADQQIRGIIDMTTQPVVRHIGTDAWRGFCRGLEITLTFDEDLYAGSGAVVFAAVLSHFFGLYTSINSFTELVMRSQDREGIVKRWAPQSGEQFIL